MRPSSLAIPVRVALAVMIASTTLAVVLPTSISSASGARNGGGPNGQRADPAQQRH